MAGLLEQDRLCSVWVAGVSISGEKISVLSFKYIRDFVFLHQILFRHFQAPVMFTDFTGFTDFKGSSTWALNVFKENCVKPFRGLLGRYR